MRNVVPGAVDRLVYGDGRDRVRAVWRVLVPVFVGFLAFGVAGGIATSLGADRGTTMLVSFGGVTLVAAGLLAVSARYLDERPVSAYGYDLSRGWWLDLLVGTGVGALLVALTVLIARGAGSLRITGTVPAAGESQVPGLVFFLLAFVGVTFYEEFLFRGLFITNAVEGLSERGHSRLVATAVALLASTAGFALIHLPSALAQGADVALVAAQTGLLGGLLGTAYVLTDQLALPMGLHLGVNYAMMNVFGIGAAGYEGIPTVLAVEVSATGPWSPTHGLPILLATLVGFVPVIAWAYRRRDGFAFDRPTTRARPEAER